VDEHSLQLGKIPCLNNKGCDFQKEILDKLDILTTKLESQETLYDGFLRSILVEFVDHRKAFILLLEANGIKCDDIKGWSENNYDNENNNRKSRRDARKERRRTRKEKRKEEKENEVKT